MKRYENKVIRTTGKGSKLSEKQFRFVEEYLLDLNAAAAVLRAGYKTNKTNAYVMGTQMLAHPLIAEAIQEKLKGRREKMELSAEYVITKLISIVEEQEQGNPTAALRGLELLGRHLGLYKDKQEISGPDGGAIQMEQKVKQNVESFKSRLDRLITDGGAGEVISFPDRTGTSGT